MVRYGPGFRFNPTDEELVMFYLKRQMGRGLGQYDYIAVVDVYKLEPWELPHFSKLKTRDLEWYFFSVLDRKYGNGSRTNRATDKGYWKTTGNDRSVFYGGRTVGKKKTLVYHEGRAPGGKRTNWVMHEYKMLETELARVGAVGKSGTGPKNGAKYGAPLIEKEWDEEEEEKEKEKEVAPLPIAHDGDFNDYMEADDLNSKLDFSDIIRSATFPSSNFHPGECSSHAEHSQVIKDLGPLEGTFGISGPENCQPLDVAEQQVVGENSVKDGDNGELSDILDLLNFPDPPNVMDVVDLYFSADEITPKVGDGSFLEADDLPIVNEGNPTEAEPFGAAMVKEYLALPDDDDDDVYKYISFDSPQIPECENSIPNQGSPFTQKVMVDSIFKNVEGEITLNAVASKHDSEVQGNTNPLVKQAYGWLASIPAAPAHAFEFPAKEIAHGLHPAAQSSNSAHITTGMISITDITFRGNAIDWMMDKNGGFNAVVPTGFSQSDVNSAAAALMPVSGKTAFVLSHGWIFLTGFSVLILSLSFKIGSIIFKVLTDGGFPLFIKLHIITLFKYSTPFLSNLTASEGKTTTVSTT
ncbi:NAC domain-containing protein 78, partial [Mucuna pruriens]